MGSFQQWKKDIKEAFNELINQDILGDKGTKTTNKKPSRIQKSVNPKEMDNQEALETTEIVNDEQQNSFEEILAHEKEQEIYEELEDLEEEAELLDEMEVIEEDTELLEGMEAIEDDAELLGEMDVLEEDAESLEETEILETDAELFEQTEIPEEEDNLLGFFETTVDEELDEIIRAVQEKRRQDPNRKSAIGKASKEELIALINTKSAEMNVHRSNELKNLRREIADLEEEVMQLTPEEIEQQIREQEERKEILQSFLKRSQERVRNQQEHNNIETEQNPEKNLSAEEIIEYRFHLPIEQSNPGE